MKVKTVSLLVKILLTILGFSLCVLNWLGSLPGATTQDIWFAVSMAYGVSMGTIDFNIIRDNWMEGKKDEPDTSEPDRN